LLSGKPNLELILRNYSCSLPESAALSKIGRNRFVRHRGAAEAFIQPRRGIHNVYETISPVASDFPYQTIFGLVLG
jgi:hypothetical protein